MARLAANPKVLACLGLAFSSALRVDMDAVIQDINEHQQQQDQGTLQEAKASRYILATINTNVCPAGSQKLTTEPSCRIASASLGLSYVRSFSAYSYPAGCFRLDTTETYFNTGAWPREGGSSNRDSTPICDTQASLGRDRSTPAEDSEHGASFAAVRARSIELNHTSFDETVSYVGTGSGKAAAKSLKAFLLCIVSGLSLPIGAFFGIKLAPVKDTVCAGMMAFGAGSLLFAVTVELYGHALRELQAEPKLHQQEMLTIIAGAIFGAMLYLWINRLLEDKLVGRTEDKVEAASSQELNPNGRKSIIAALNAMQSSSNPAETAAGVLDEDAQKAKQVALALFLGLLVDGVPEGFLMGFLAAEDHLTPVFIVSLFVANFPEAFASSSLLKQANFGTATIIGMWTGLCVLVGVLGAFSSGMLLYVYPDYGPGTHLPVVARNAIALVEGTTGGAMIACISSVMLPEAFERAGKHGKLFASSGFLCTLGFLMAVGLKVLELHR